MKKKNRSDNIHSFASEANGQTVVWVEEDVDISYKNPLKIINYIFDSQNSLFLFYPML